MVRPGACTEHRRPCPGAGPFYRVTVIVVDAMAVARIAGDRMIVATVFLPANSDRNVTE